MLCTSQTEMFVDGVGGEKYSTYCWILVCALTNAFRANNKVYS